MSDKEENTNWYFNYSSNYLVFSSLNLGVYNTQQMLSTAICVTKCYLESKYHFPSL